MLDKKHKNSERRDNGITKSHKMKLSRSAEGEERTTESTET